MAVDQMSSAAMATATTSCNRQWHSLEAQALGCPLGELGPAPVTAPAGVPAQTPYTAQKTYSKKKQKNS
jgi:hypothetical protein